MRRAAFIMLLLLGSGSAARADPTSRAAACYTIPDADARAACLARAHRDPGRCYSVQDALRRAECLAEERR